MHQIAAIDERHDLHARRQDGVVQFLHFLVNSLQRRIGVGAFAQQRNPRNHVVVIDQLAVLMPDRPANWPSRIFGPWETTAISSPGAECRSWP
jgi:hypothetical protein